MTLSSRVMEDHDETTQERSELPLEVRAEMAFKVAVEKVIVEHARQGWPFISGAMAK